MFHKSGGPGGPNADATKVAKIMLLIRTKVKKSKIHGLGLFAAQFVSKGTKTWKLKPKIDLVITASEYKKLPKPFRKNIDHHIYQCKFTRKWIFCTDDARFMNHSTKPNIKTVRGMYDVALRDIKKGEELTEDYDRFE
jgi:SET domain-containing protein